MAIAGAKLAGGKLSVRGRTVLSGVSAAVVASSASTGKSVDGVTSPGLPASVISLGGFGIASQNTRTNQLSMFKPFECSSWY